MKHSYPLPVIALILPVRSRKRNSKKSRKIWATNSHLRRRPITSEDFSDLQKGKFDWKK